MGDVRKVIKMAFG